MMKTKSFAGAMLGAAILTLVALSACSEALRAGIEVTPENPQLTGRDASGVEAPSVALCNAYDCPEPYASCADKSGVCTTNLSNDTEHCGSCDVKCPQGSAGLHAFFVCTDARCQMLCQDNASDCDGLVDNGCETSLDSDPANCGTCGNVCADGEICWQGACGCPTGQMVCNGQCVRVSEDPMNCGACGRACHTLDPKDVVWPCGEGQIPPGAELTCVNSTCQPACQGGRANCNTDFCRDGCEVETSVDENNCGKCGRACAAEQECAQGQCLCEEGVTRCSGTCVDLQSDPFNCGVCGNVCPGPADEKGSPVCDLGRCTYACAVGYASCDGRLENGCEVDLTVDPRHCGACDTQCDLTGGQPCAAGKCLTRPCDAGVIH